ncbi:PRC-barrel domain containing protein [Streptomyces misionensis]|uniref:PRC-barrel domain containing protein n=1 Tax=Streptomyces misionensis TaxID=67331 RepID=A0A5C6J0X1_9ACTN|nr:PRC-barrel domain-containing protein [Streptomyces misionensis]TWV34402.1 PRC-barrel domain containing protein [Streptomyces misionensis]
MITPLLASELTKRVVVTLSGEAVAQVKDTVFDFKAGRITGFTLSGRGLLAGPLKVSLPFSGVHAIGPFAVMVPSAAVLTERKAVLAAHEAEHGQVIGAPVLTDRGTEAGTVLDVVIEAGSSGRLIGFEIAMKEDTGTGHERRRAFIPRGEALAVSGRAMIVPAHARHFVADDLPSFGAQVEAFRRHTARPSHLTPTTTEEAQA